MAKFTGLSHSDILATHVINRDAVERYIAVVVNGDIRVFDLAGTEKTVTLDTGAAAYLTGAAGDFALVTVADYTFVLNKTVVVEMESATIPQPTPRAIVHVSQFVSDGTYRILVDSFEGSFGDIDSSDTETAASSLVSSLIADMGGSASLYSIVRSSSTIFIERVNGADFDISIVDPWGDQGMLLTKDSVSTPSDLPAKAVDGTVIRVESDTDSDGYWVEFHEAPEGTYKGSWQETVAPGSQTLFDAETMPYALVRQVDGSFTVERIAWSEKLVGDDDTVPTPDFVGQTISDIVFHRNRLVLLAGETAFFSQAGDYFNLWPDKSTETLDSDPFGKSGSTNKVAIFKFAVPFRKSLFITSNLIQFEVSGAELLTPERTSIDVSTEYAASENCRPVAVGDELFFASHGGDDAVLMNYLYDESTLGNTAGDITKHAKGYVPSPVVELAGDSVTGSLFARSSSDTDAVYVYTFFYNGDDKVQSSWGRWRWPDATIKGMGIIDSYLYTVVDRSGTVWIERTPITKTGYDDYDWAPRLDRQVRVTGTYSAITGLTSFTTTLPAGLTLIGVTSNGFDDTKRMRQLTLTSAGAGVYTTPGDYSGDEVLIGLEYPSQVVFSKQYPKDRNGNSILTGRLQLERFTVAYEDTAFFEAVVTPYLRADITREFDARDNAPGDPIPVADGTFAFTVKSNAKTVEIKIVNDSFMPHIITSAAWTGFFNEVTRQG